MRIALAILFSALALSAAEWFASPTGSSTGAGSIGDPWSIVSALTNNLDSGAVNTAVVDGDTIWMRGGSYTGAFTSYLVATNINTPIKIRAYPGERPAIDGSSTSSGLSIWGSNCWYMNLEMLSSATQRTNQRQNGITIFGSHTKVINCVVHDCGTGILPTATATNSEVYGCIIFNNGWQSAVRGSGHALYAQNNSGLMLLKHNFLLNQYGWGLHLYGESGNVQNILAHRNVIFGGGLLSDEGVNPNILVDGSSTVDDITISSNLVYMGVDLELSTQFGKTSGTSLGDIIIGTNYFGSGYNMAGRWTNVTFRGNQLMDGRQSLWYDTAKPFPPAYNWDANSITFNASSSPCLTNGVNLTFAAWKSATTFDSNTTFSATFPSSTDVFVWANEYDTNRFHIVAFNWPEDPTVSVDISSFVSSGQWISVKSVANYFGADVVGGRYTGGSISIPTEGIPVAQPAGWTNEVPESGPRFNAYVMDIVQSRWSATAGTTTVQNLNSR